MDVREYCFESCERNFYLAQNEAEKEKRISLSLFSIYIIFCYFLNKEKNALIKFHKWEDKSTKMETYKKRIF